MLLSVVLFVDAALWTLLPTVKYEGWQLLAWQWGAAGTCEAPIPPPTESPRGTSITDLQRPGPGGRPNGGKRRTLVTAPGVAERCEWEITKEEKKSLNPLFLFSKLRRWDNYCGQLNKYRRLRALKGILERAECKLWHWRLFWRGSFDVEEILPQTISNSNYNILMLCVTGSYCRELTQHTRYTPAEKRLKNSTGAKICAQQTSEGGGHQFW